MHEVLQLICARAQALTQAETVLVALFDENGLACHAAAGALAVPQGARLNIESRLLQDSFDSSKTLCSDEIETDPRAQCDFARRIEARSTVIVPLCGQSERLGVLQAFSTVPGAFTDWDVRCLDLLGELVLGALKPADQDRRAQRLSERNASGARNGSREGQFASAAAALAMPGGSAALRDGGSSVGPTEASSRRAEQLAPPGSRSTDAQLGEARADGKAEIADLQRTLATTKEQALSRLLKESVARRVVSSAAEAGTEKGPVIAAVNRCATQKQPPSRFSQQPAKPWFLHDVFLPLTSRPGLSVVAGMVAIAGLFSAGVWWGMQVDTRTRATHAPIKISATSQRASSYTPSDISSPSAGGSETGDVSQSPDAALAPVAENKLADLPKITSVRHWSSPGGTTVVIDMDNQVNYEVHRLMSPDRIYFDLHDTALPADLEGKTMDVGDASLASVRIAQPIAGVTRVVLDTKDGSNFSVSMETNPYRLVIELRKGPETLVAGRAATAPAPLTAKVSPPQLALPARTGKFRIVLDAGHGGWDLGTVGRQGLLEKDLVLDVAQRLGKLLQSRIGADVMFTRTADDYVALDQRADYANQAQADLFVSVHANYSNEATARGVETYYTNLFSAPGLKEIEKQSTAIPPPAPAALSAPGLLEKTEESRRLAASVQRSLYATLAANNPNIRDRGIKDSSFVVLTGTTMPSILTEISFVSSPADEHNLQSEAYRQQIAEALYKGIASYEEASPRAKVAQLHSSAGSR